MQETQLTHLRDRLAARLGDRTLNRYQLIDIATVLVFAHRDLLQGFDAHGSTAAQKTAIVALRTSLNWIFDHGADAPCAELRVHVTAAADNFSRALDRRTSHLPLGAHPSSQEHAHT